MKAAVTYRGTALPTASSTESLCELDNRRVWASRYSYAIYNTRDGSIVGSWSPDAGTTWHEFYRQALPGLSSRTGHVGDVLIEEYPYFKFEWENGSTTQDEFEVQQVVTQQREPGASDPATILGDSLELWLRSDRGVTESGGEVTQWACPYTGRTFSQITPTQGPTRNASDPNWGGLPSLTFPNGDGLRSDDVAGTYNFLHNGTGGGALVVCRPGTQTGTFNWLLSNYDGTAPGFELYYEISGTAQFAARVATTAGATILNPAGAEALHNTNAYVLAAYEDGRAGNEYLLRYFGTDTTGNDSAAPAATDPAYQLVIGSRGNTISEFTGEILEVILFSVYPTAGQIAALEAYLEARYGLWTPASIFGAGLHTWLRSDDITGVADGGTVASWTDRSGNSHDFVQATEGFKPTYNSSDANWRGLPSVTFNNDFMDSDEAAATWQFMHDGTGATWIVVCRPGTQTASFARLLSTDDATTAGINAVYSIGATPDSFGMTILNSTPAFVVNVHNTNAFLEGTKAYVIEAYEEGRAGNEWLIHVNGLESSGNSALAPSAVAPGVALRIGDRGSGGNPFIGEILEIIIVSRYLTDSEKTRLAGYMNQRYAL